VIRTPRGVADDEALVLIAALIPNRRGQPVLNDWFVVRVDTTGVVRGLLSLEELCEQTGLGRTPLANAGVPFDAKRLQGLLTPALQHARERMAALHKTFSAEASDRSSAELARLEELRRQHQQQLALNFKEGEEAIAHLRAAKRDNEAREIDRLFDSYRAWVSQTLELDSRAHLTVAAVLISTGAGI
jgi:hypothetical protein